MSITKFVCRVVFVRNFACRSSSSLSPVGLFDVHLRTRPSSLCETCKRFNYDGPGRTTASFVDDEVGKFILVNSINDRGFRLTNGAFAVGSIILFPSFVFRWKVNTIEEITPESLQLFRMIEPKIELLVLGIGHAQHWPTESLQTMRENLDRIKDLKIEIMSSKDAVATYNFMLNDFRLIGGAFLPLPSDVRRKLIESQRKSRT